MADYEAGRELDKLIAEKVMGLPRVEKKYVTFDPECGTDMTAYDLTAQFANPPEIDYCYQTDEEAEHERDFVQNCEQEEDPQLREVYLYDYRRGQRIGYKLVPHYSTDIVAAWEIVEKLDEKDAWLDELANKWESSWRCIVTRRTPGSIRYYQDWGAETAPLAICRAALQMVEGA